MQEDPANIVHVARVDLKDEALRIRVLKSQGGLETLEEMVSRVTAQGERLLVAVNGDYFEPQTSIGMPCGIQIDDSEIIFPPRGRAMLALGEGNRPAIALATLEAKVQLGRKTFELEGFNLPREFRKDQLGPVAYTRQIYTHTPSNIYSREWVIEGLAEGLLVGETATGKVTKISRGGGEEIPEKGTVISVVQGIPPALMDAEVGDEITFKLRLPQFKGRVVEAVGGGPILVRKGKVSLHMEKESFPPSHRNYLRHRPHPRTGVGFDRKGRYLFLVVVEGRHQGSEGQTLDELAEFMRKIGAYEAMAFDGGGSSAMYVENFLVSVAWDPNGNRTGRLVANSVAVSLAPGAEEEETESGK